MLPEPFAGVAEQTDGAGAAGRPGPVDSYPFISGPADSVDKVRLQRVVDVMQQFLGFSSSSNINSMLTGG